MTPLGWIEDIARRREPDDERIRHDAFVADIAAHAPEASRRLTSRLAHLRARVDSGSVSLAQVGVAGLAAMSGVMITALAGIPTTQRYDCDPVAWAEPMLSLGLVLLAFECVRRPRVVQRSPVAFAAFALLAVGCLACAATAGREIPVLDESLVGGTAIIGVGALVAGVGLAIGGHRVVRAGLTAIGVGAVGVFISGGAWVAIYAADDDHLHALGSFVAAAGSLIMANGLIASRPEILGGSNGRPRDRGFRRGWSSA